MKRIFLAGLMFLGVGGPIQALNAATFLYFTSSPESWIGQGQTLTLTNGFYATRTYNLGAYTDSVHLGAGGYELTIVGPGLTLPTVGFYPDATRWPFMGSGAGMSFTGPGRGNNTLTGCFYVLQADYDATGQPAAFAVDFVQYDSGNLSKWNRASVRFNSDIPVPASPPPMRLTAIGVTNGFAQFVVTGPPDTECVIERSSDLLTWVPLHTNMISPVGSVPISDPGSIGEPHRFYRAVSSSGGGSGGNNDPFANRVQIPPAGGTVTGSNVDATKEAGEPNHGDVSGGKSVWWTWTAPANGIVNIGTDGSSFDTTLGVYQGTDVASLTTVFEDDDAGTGSRSRAVFNATVGVTYQIAVDGYAGASGDIQLTVKMGVPNDAFANRLQLAGSYDVYFGHNIGAATEAGEPFHWDTTGGSSVWWTWTAPATGVVTFTTAGSNFDTILAAYTGNSVGGLTLMANNDDYGGMTSQISFTAIAGTTYQIAVDGYDGWMGGILLQVQQ